MNEKIQALANELQEECRKEGVALLCTMQKEGEGKVMVAGSLPEIGLLLALQERNSDNESPIKAEILRKAALLSLKEMETDEGTNIGHTFVTDDLNDISEILKSFMRGDYE
ncbi:hypothetical protein [Enterococcus casseliflavus]|uniref:hypothetical protein n=1 Tax=Enterococcus casseliflavus TaxID=37734 RepID=UPI003D0FCFA6